MKKKLIIHLVQISTILILFDNFKSKQNSILKFNEDLLVVCISQLSGWQLYVIVKGFSNTTKVYAKWH